MLNFKAERTVQVQDNFTPDLVFSNNTQKREIKNEMKWRQ